MKKLLKKIDQLEKDDPENVANKFIKEIREEAKDREKNPKKYEKIDRANAELAKKKEAKEAMIIKNVIKKLDKYKKDKIDLQKVIIEINKRFDFKKAECQAAYFKSVASIYFNAAVCDELPTIFYLNAPTENPYSHCISSQEEWALNDFQSHLTDMGTTIPTLLKNEKDFIIHGILFTMTSTVIYMTSAFGVVYVPNDELFGREWRTTDKSEYKDNYSDAIKVFEKYLDHHLTQEEIYYQKIKKK
jgi:hypothetical protein